MFPLVLPASFLLLSILGGSQTVDRSVRTVIGGGTRHWQQQETYSRARGSTLGETVEGIYSSELVCMWREENFGTNDWSLLSLLRGRTMIKTSLQAELEGPKEPQNVWLN